MMRLVLVVLAVCALLAAGCSDDDDDADEEDSSADSREAEDSDDGAAPEDDDGDNDAEDELPSDFNDLLTNLERFRAEYEVEGQDDEGNDLSGNLTILGLEGSLRIDFEGFESEGEEFSGSVIATTDAIYLCGEDIGEGEEGSCFEFPGTGDLDETGIPFSDLLGDILPLADDAGIEVTETDGREVAGEDADCFTVTQEEVEEELEGEALVCLSDSGLPLLVDGTAEGGDFQLEATDVSDDVSAEDFERPYPVEDFDLGDFDLDDLETPDDDEG